MGWHGFIFLAALAAAVGGCDEETRPGDIETQCSDGIDNDGDGLTDCEDDDCPGCAFVDAGTDAGGASGCRVSSDEEPVDSCTDSNICICPEDVQTRDDVNCSGSCEEALPGTYLIVVQEASIPATKPSGSAWDIDGSDPDPFVELSVGGDSSMTSTKMNTMTPSWGESAEVDLSLGDSMEFTVWDRDSVDHDEVGTCTFEVGPGVLRARIGSCDGDILSLLVAWFPL